MNNSDLIELYCGENRLTSLSLETNTALRLLACSNNPLTSLDISNLYDFFLQDGTCGCGGYLDLSNIPSLQQVCVWTTPFPPQDSAWPVFTGGSPDLYFKDCAPPSLKLSGEISYQPESVEAISSEDGRIYLVTENTAGTIETIVADSLKSVEAYRDSAVTISLEGLHNGIYWLYAADPDHNISMPEAVSIRGVSIERNPYNPVKIYPQPVESVLTIELDTPGVHSIQILSLNGKQVRIRTGMGAISQIDLTGLESGVYMLQILTGKQLFTQKLIKL
jgi:hypothetical protein